MKNNYITQALERDSAWLDIKDFPAKGGAYLLKGDGFVWEDFWRETSTGDAYWEEEAEVEPTHYMPVDAPELLFAEMKRLRAQ